MQDYLEQTGIRSDKEIRDLLVSCMFSTKLTAQVFFPERFTKEFSKEIHDPIFALIDSNDPYVAIAAPRGFGKTSIVGLGLTSRYILFRLCNFILYVSKSATSAEMQTENLKIELLSNTLLKTLFGDIKPSKEGGFEDSFSKKTWKALETLVLPRGSGQQVRGLLYRNARPDLIVIDDLEDPETIANDEIRQKRKEWFHADLMKCTSRVDKNYKIVYIDTLKHEDSLLEDLLQHPDWASVRLEACDDEYNSTAPNFMSTEEIKAERDYHREAAMMDVFFREFRNIPISLEDAAFKPEYFRHYTEGINELTIPEQEIGEVKIPQKTIRTSNLINLVICDPAKEVKIHNADSAIVGIGIDRVSQNVFVRDIVHGKLYPDEIYSEMFAMLARLKSWILAVEVTSLHQFISQPIENEMRVRGVHAQYIELKATGKKEERIAHMVPYYRQGYVYHNSACCDILESQLLGYPRSKLWDVMDAEAYFVKLLDELALYFDPPDHDDSGFNEFEELEELNEPKMAANWRF
jgi:hypothetical protein